MRAFFTQRNKEVEDRNNLDAVDIFTNKYRTSIRLSGISVIDLKTGKTIINETLDFTEQKENKK